MVRQESIMKTSIIGYPRVGSLRELKFTTEKYFRGEISVEELQNTAKEIRKTQWTLQKIPDWISFRQMIFLSMI